MRIVAARLQVEFRNFRFEGHSALTDHASFLRRKKHRGVTPSRDGGVQHRDAVQLTDRIGDTAAPTALRSAAWASGGRLEGTRRPAQRDSIGGSVLPKPQPLDLAAIVAPGFAKNQGTDAEEAFRAVGLTSKIGGGGAEAGALPEVPSLLSPPHLFWKAVLVTPSRSRGNVGAWLQAKFGSGEGGRLSEYQRGLASRGLSPSLQAGGVEDNEVACGSSGRSRLIHRSLRWVGAFVAERCWCGPFVADQGRLRVATVQ